MLLALDVGNTNTVLGLYRLDAEAGLPPKGSAVAAKERSDLTAHWRITTHRTQTVDEYGVLFVNLFEMHGMSPSQVTHIIISSVVPPIDSTLRQVCETYFHVEPLFVEPGIKTGMPALVDNPTELGADRIADCIAAIERYGGPCIVVDFGTATKFEVISEKGEYLGGADQQHSQQYDGGGGGWHAGDVADKLDVQRIDRRHYDFDHRYRD